MPLQNESFHSPQSPPAICPCEKVAPTTLQCSPPAADSSPTSMDDLQRVLEKTRSSEKGYSFSHAPSWDFIPRLIPNDTSTVRGRVVIFSTITNTFTLRTVGPAMTLRYLLLVSPQCRIYQMPIKPFEGKVDLGKAGVRIGEGLVDKMVKQLPRKVVTMRIWGW